MPTPINEEFCQLVVARLNELRQDQISIMTRWDAADVKMAMLEQGLTSHATASADRYNKILAAFPSSDTDGHRRYHEAVIEKMELRNKILREMLLHCAKFSGLAAFCWLLYTIWNAIKLEFH